MALWTLNPATSVGIPVGPPPKFPDIARRRRSSPDPLHFAWAPPDLCVWLSVFALWIRTTVEKKRIEETPGVAPSGLLHFALCFLGLLCLHVPSSSCLLGPDSSASHTQSGDASYWGAPPPCCFVHSLFVFLARSGPGAAAAAGDLDAFRLLARCAWVHPWLSSETLCNTAARPVRAGATRCCRRCSCRLTARSLALCLQ